MVRHGLDGPAGRVRERDGRTLIAFGAYDPAVHLIDAADGADVLPPFVTGDLIKGSVTIDPDGFPLLYTGSRDDYYRVLSFDGSALTELWKINATTSRRRSGTTIGTAPPS